MGRFLEKKNTLINKVFKKKFIIKNWSPWQIFFTEIFFGKICPILDSENWIWKLKFWDLWQGCSQFWSVQQGHYLVKKCLFPIDALVVWCPTRSKNLGRIYCDYLLTIFCYIFLHCVLCIFERKFLNWYLEWQQQANCCSDCSSSKICVKICILYIRVPTLFFQPFTIIQILILFLSVQIWYNLVYFSGSLFLAKINPDLNGNQYESSILKYRVIFTH